MDLNPNLCTSDHKARNATDQSTKEYEDWGEIPWNEDALSEGRFVFTEQNIFPQTTEKLRKRWNFNRTYQWLLTRTQQELSYWKENRSTLLPGISTTICIQHICSLLFPFHPLESVCHLFDSHEELAEEERCEQEFVFLLVCMTYDDIYMHVRSIERKEHKQGLLESCSKGGELFFHLTKQDRLLTYLLPMVSPQKYQRWMHAVFLYSDMETPCAGWVRLALLDYKRRFVDSSKTTALKLLLEGDQDLVQSLPSVLEKISKYCCNAIDASSYPEIKSDDIHVFFSLCQNEPICFPKCLEHTLEHTIVDQLKWVLVCYTFGTMTLQHPWVQSVIAGLFVFLVHEKQCNMKSVWTRLILHHLGKFQTRHGPLCAFSCTFQCLLKVPYEKEEMVSVSIDSILEEIFPIKQTRFLLDEIRQVDPCLWSKLRGAFVSGHKSSIEESHKSGSNDCEDARILIEKANQAHARDTRQSDESQKVSV